MKIPSKVYRFAEYEAMHSPHRFRLGAVIFKRNRMLGWGHNEHLKTHPKSPHPHFSIHAEFAAVIDAIRHADDNTPEFRGASIYVCRLKADDTFGIAKPCVHCQFMLKQLEIDKIYWSDDGTKSAFGCLTD